MGQRNSIEAKSNSMDDKVVNRPKGNVSVEEGKEDVVEPAKKKLTCQVRYCRQLDDILNDAVKAKKDGEAKDGDEDDAVVKHDRFLKVFSDWASELRQMYPPNASAVGAQEDNEYSNIIALLLVPGIPDDVKSEVARLYSADQDWGAPLCIDTLCQSVKSWTKWSAAKVDIIKQSQLLILRVLGEKPGTMLRIRQVEPMRKLVSYLLERDQLQLLLKLFPAFKVPVLFDGAECVRLLAAKSPDADALLIAYLDQVPTSIRLMKVLCSVRAPDIDSYDSDSDAEKEEEEEEEGKDKDESGSVVGEVDNNNAKTRDVATRRRTLLYHVYCKRPAVWPSMQLVIERFHHDGYFVGRGSDNILNVLYLAAVRDDAVTIEWLVKLGVFGLDTWKTLLAAGQFRASARQRIQRIISSEF